MAKLMSSHKVSELRRSITKLIDIDASLKPIDGFEVLIANNIESAPVYVLRPDPTSSSSSSSSTSSTSPGSPSRGTSLSVITQGNQQRDESKMKKDYIGFLDVRDLLSSVVYVYNQPINEDELVFTATGAAEVDFVPSTRGLAGIASLDDVASLHHYEVVAPREPLPSMDEEENEGKVRDNGSSDTNDTGRTGPESHTGTPDTSSTSTSLSSTTLTVPTTPNRSTTSSSGDDKLMSLESSALGGRSPRSPGRRLRELPTIEDVERELRTQDEQALQADTVKKATTAMYRSPLTWAETIRRGMRRFQSSHPISALSSSSSSSSSSGSHTRRLPSPFNERSPPPSPSSTPKRGPTDLTLSSLSPSGNPPSPSKMEREREQRDGSSITLTYLARRNPFKAVRPSSPISLVCDLMCMGHHRVPVVDDQGVLIDIISQSSIIQFILNHKHELTESGMSIYHYL